MLLKSDEGFNVGNFGRKAADDVACACAKKKDVRSFAMVFLSGYSYRMMEGGIMMLLQTQFPLSTKANEAT